MVKHIFLRDVNLLCDVNELKGEFLAKVRSTGNLLPCKILENGDFLGLGKNNEKVPNPVLAEDHGYAWMVRMEYDGDTLWERKDLVFPDSIFATGQYLHSAVELSSGSIIAAGYYDSSADPKNWGILQCRDT